MLEKSNSELHKPMLFHVRAGIVGAQVGDGRVVLTVVSPRPDVPPVYDLVLQFDEWGVVMWPVWAEIQRQTAMTGEVRP